MSRATWVVVGGSDGQLHQLDVTDPATMSFSVTLGDGLAAVGMPTMDLMNWMIYVGTDQGVIYGVEFPLPELEASDVKRPNAANPATG